EDCAALSKRFVRTGLGMPCRPIRVTAVRRQGQRGSIENYNWTDDHTGNRLEALRLAREALQYGADDPVALAFAGQVLGWFGEDVDAALQLAERSVALNTGYARGWYYRGLLNLYAGRTEQAIEDIEIALRLDPRANRGISVAHIGIAHFFNMR